MKMGRVRNVSIRTKPFFGDLAAVPSGARILGTFATLRQMPPHLTPLKLRPLSRSKPDVEIRFDHNGVILELKLEILTDKKSFVLVGCQIAAIVGE